MRVTMYLQLIGSMPLSGHHLVLKYAFAAGTPSWRPVYDQA